MNTEQLIERVDAIGNAMIEFDTVDDVHWWNGIFWGMFSIKATLREYRVLGIEPPPSFMAYVDAQVEAALIAMPDAAWAESEAAT